MAATTLWQGTYARAQAKMAEAHRLPVARDRVINLVMRRALLACTGPWLPHACVQACGEIVFVRVTRGRSASGRTAVSRISREDALGTLGGIRWGGSRRSFFGPFSQGCMNG